MTPRHHDYLNWVMRNIPGSLREYHAVKIVYIAGVEGPRGRRPKHMAVVHGTYGEWPFTAWKALTPEMSVDNAKYILRQHAAQRKLCGDT